ncbi:MAG TPA: non-canonical purine NTP pyrophosphatase [Desulfuromonadaceae bacterium]|nr:non-canonical purine NTP pyrophosphatase [Desulfuromonadaceae bacterium]
MTTLLLATRNEHKVEEIRAILGGSFRCLCLHDFIGVPKVSEDADSFAGNATKKAIELAHWLTMDDTRFQTKNSKLDFVLADDSGLKVDALNGAPGIHSARFAALDTKKPGNSPDADNNAKLLRLMKNVPADKRTARFRCVIALTAVPEGTIESSSPVCFADKFQTEIFDGVCTGKILAAPRGANGFGYDPLFVPDGYDQTFAELSDEIKNQISHRSKALGKLKAYLEGRPAAARS